MVGVCLLFVGFVIKVPSVPLHTWLPDAHVEAPTPISMILAGFCSSLVATASFAFVIRSVQKLPTTLPMSFAQLAWSVWFGVRSRVGSDGL